MTTKKELRAELKKLAKSSLDKGLCKVYSQSVVENILKTEEFQKANAIGLYHALFDEPSLAYILDNFADKKELYLPRCESATEIEFFRYRGPQDLRIGAFGIEEPQADPKDAVDPQHLDLILVPATIYDKKGIRLGRGKGYYDRYLPKADKAAQIGVTYGLKEVDCLPSDPWDRAVDKVISPKGIFIPENK
ncbi:5-formyltetrahydrofolate cyclo-ligase [Falsiporphyromonas endometrii]|uniref:5-formyltetrahydrofolate cyclo-ligase n=1 Tax=Falsiporphyromonas endometrii TaxID=1387297 RepID=A0ABV9K4I1_9PORP